MKYDDPDKLEKEIKERVKRLLNASVVDTMPFGDTLDEELGLGEYKDTDEEIEEEDIDV